MTPRLSEVRAAAQGAEGSVVILSANPMHDTGGGQRSAQLALEFLERGFAVAFVSHGQVTETVDLGLSYRHQRLVELPLTAVDHPRGAEVLAPLFELDQTLVLTQVPVREWDAVERLARRHGAVTVYDCIDRWDSELGRGWYSRSAEGDVAAGADVLTASAPALVEHVEMLAGREALLLPNAFNARLFDRDAASLSARPDDLPAADRIALYVGALWGGWMDWALVRRAAQAHPDTALVFIGDHRNEGRGLPENCHFLGLKPQKDLPPYLLAAELAFIPWELGALTEATSPLKAYEFVAMELPVVAPAIEPLRAIPGVVTCEDAESFVSAVGSTGRGSNPEERRAEMRDFARSNSWEQRVDALMAAVGGAAAQGDTPGPAVHTGATISVVIPSYNHERYIGAAMDSVRDQSLAPSELVIVDDGSTDGSREVIEDHRFMAVRTVFQENRGAHRALNRAIALSGGDYVAILNSDDLFTPDRIEHAWGVARTTGAALVCGAVRLVDEHGGDPDPEHDIVRWYREARAAARRAPSMSEALRNHNVAVTTSNFFVHRELWSRLGGFSAFRYVHDYDFLLRAVALCPDRVRYVDAMDDVLYRVHGVNTITESVERAQAERREMLRALKRPAHRVRRWLGRGAGRRAVAAAVDETDALDPTTTAGAVTSVTEPVRAGIVVSSLGTGGLEEVVALLAQSLPGHGVNVSVLCTRAGGRVADRLSRAGISVRVERDPRAWRGWADEGGLQVVSSHFAPVEVVEAIHGSGVPVVETIQNVYAWFSDDDWAAERAKLRSLTATIAVSETVARHYRTMTGRATDWIIPNAVHPGRAAAVPRAFARGSIAVDPDVPLFVSVGRVAVQKNPLGLLRAFERVHEARPDARLLLVGPTDHGIPLARLKAKHRALFKRGAVEHRGAVADVGTFLSAADAFVSNSFHEGWSVAASEAAWVGLPVVLSETGGAAELTGPDGAFGILVPNPAGDPLRVDKRALVDPPPAAAAINEEALAEALLSVARDRERWRQRAPDIRTRARTTLAPDCIASSYADALLSLAHDARESR
jgi:glycosyltransferase involved in cell wall biosynthesis